MPPATAPRIGPTIVLAVVWLALLTLWLAIRPAPSTRPSAPAPAATTSSTRVTFFPRP